MTFRRRKERLSSTGDQRIHNQPEFIYQHGIDKIRNRSRAPEEVKVSRNGVALNDLLGNALILWDLRCRTLQYPCSNQY